jgi:hypothetical protein
MKLPPGPGSRSERRAQVLMASLLPLPMPRTAVLGFGSLCSAIGTRAVLSFWTV